MGRPATATVLVTVAPWTAVGAVVHGTVLTVAVVPLLVALFRPPPLVALALLVVSFLGLSALVYVLLAPGGFASARAKFATGVAVGGLGISGFCLALLLYWLRTASGQTALTPLLLGTFGVVAIVVAVAASLEAIVSGLDGA